jgi:non-ribosomal peptide synthase protein (TIGR01720 family)
VQQWFFERDSPEPHHYNQAMLLAVERPLDEAWLDAAAKKLQRHDALQLRFRRGAEGWVQSYGPSHEEGCFAVIDLSMFDEYAARPLLEEIAAAEQKRLDTEHGPLFRIVHFRMAPGAASRLLIIVHHLAIDAVSWRTIFDDLFDERAQPQSASFRRWAERLVAYATSGEARAELGYWLAAERMAAAPLFQADSEANSAGSAGTITSLLAAAETAALLRGAQRRYGCTVEELALTALALALRDVLGCDRAFVDVEWHGRDARFDDVDVTNTVGWFTSIAPLLLRVPADADRAAALAAVKEQLRALPHHGIGFGVLRYLDPDPSTRELLRALPAPRISFNYLGHWDGTLLASGVRIAPESEGASISPLMRRAHVLELNAIVIDGAFRADWTFAPALADVARRLSERFVETMTSLAAAGPARGRGTPLDGLDVFVAEEMETWKIPGLSLGVLRDGEVLCVRGYGVRESGGTAPITPTTLFELGSVAKAFNAVWIARLQQEGLLSWNELLHDRLPELVLPDGEATRRLTLRDLVAHRAGIPSGDFLLRFSGLPRREVAERVRHLPSWRGFGTFGYSNLSAVLAAYATERIRGLAWDDAIRRDVLQPLGMSAVTCLDDLIRLEFAKPHRAGVPVPFFQAEAAAPSHAVYGSADDLLALAALHFNGGRHDGRQFLASDDVTEMQTPQVAVVEPLVSPGPEYDPDLFGRLSYGLGLMLTRYRGRRLLFHTGHGDGFAAQFAILPDDGLAAVVLCNAQGSTVPTWLAYDIFDRLLGDQRVPWSDRLRGRAAALPVTAPPVRRLPIADRGSYRGVYEHPAYGALVIDDAGDRLLLSHGASKAELHCTGSDTFVGVAASSGALHDAGVRFERNGRGDVSGLRFAAEEQLPPLLFARSPVGTKDRG